MADLHSRLLLWARRPSSGVAARAGWRSETIEDPTREGVELGARRLGGAVERRAPLRVRCAQRGSAFAENVGPVRLIGSTVVSHMGSN